MLQTTAEILGAFCAFLGPFSLMDSLLPKETKRKLSEYVFGFHGIQTSDFERVLVHAWLDAFYPNGRLSKRRLLTFSILASIASMCMLVVFFGSSLTTNANYRPVVDEALLIVVLGTFMGLLSVPFDAMNLRVTNWVYRKRFSQARAFIQLWLDAVISFALSVAFALVILSVAIAVLFVFNVDTSAEDMTPGRLVVAILSGIGIIGGPLSILTFFFMRSVFFGTGIVLRNAIRLSNLNSYVTLVSSAHTLPITYTAGIGYLMVACIGLLFG